jgi:hypothetical protein
MSDEKSGETMGKPELTAGRKKNSHVADHLKPWRIPKGQSGNPKGRPLGARNRLSEAFIETLQEVWKERGREIIDRAIEQNPTALISAIARLVPKDFQVTIAGAVQVSHELSPEQRQRIAESWILSQQSRPAITAEAVRDNLAQGG